MMSEARVARELVEIAKSLAATHPREASNMVSELLRIRPGKHKTFKLADVGDHSTLYAHIWFDDNVAETDFGDNVPDSGEWQIIFTLKDKPGGREQARETFRYAEPHRREEIAAYAVKWMKKMVFTVARRMR